MNRQRLVVGISGSSGAILGIRLLEALKPTPIETHLIITPAARLTIEQETTWRVSDVQALADVHYSPNDMAAAIASGSFNTMGMLVIPCSIKSLSAIANSYSGDLLTRAADVALKEGRPLLLVVRETPLHPGHIRLMAQAAESGAVIFPPVPAFYTHPQSVDEMVDNLVGRVLSRLGIENELYQQWQGLASAPKEKTQPVTLRTQSLGAESQRAESQGAESTPGQPITVIETSRDQADLWSLPAMTLATTGVDGSPHAAAVYFAASPDRQDLYFFSAADSQHSQDLSANPQAAAAIQPETITGPVDASRLRVEGWQAIRGLQLRGQVLPVPEGNAWNQGWALYLEKFPFVGELQDVVRRSTLYTFRPDWVRWIDNRRGFEFKEEWTRE